MRTSRTRLSAIAAVAALSLFAAACGDDGDDAATTDAPTATEAGGDDTMGSEPMGTEPMGSEPMGTDPMGSEPMGTDDGGTAMEPSGPACASVPADGEGSFSGMADDPAATAASNNPELSTLVAAVDAAGLVDTLNGPGPFTIFAPANSAFEMIPAEDLDALLAEPEGALTDILTLHVIAGEQLSSTDLVEAGSSATVNGEEITFEMDGDALSVNGQASVVCADIPTANATVHIIDTVLSPGMSEGTTETTMATETTG